MVYTIGDKISFRVGMVFSNNIIRKHTEGKQLKLQKTFICSNVNFPYTIMKNKVSVHCISPVMTYHYCHDNNFSN